MICKADFLGLKELPDIKIDRDSLEELARKSIGKRVAVSGVQKKLSIHFSDDDSTRLTLLDHPAGFILKPQTEDFTQLPEAEDLVMDIADMMGVRTVPHGLLDIGGEFAYITKRVDRADGNIYAMEDFCQLSGRLTQDKYRGSYERCARIIRDHSTMVGFDLSEFYLRLIVCFVTGNSDMHLKNFSLIERNSGMRDFVLSPAYDLLPVNVIMPEDEEETALTLNGKKSRLQRKDFLESAERMGIGDNIAERMISSVISKRDRALRLCDGSSLNPKMKASMAALIHERCNRLEGQA